MSNFWIILSHTYFSKLKAKPFIITTLIVAVGILIMTNMGKIIDIFDDEEADKIAVIDQSGVLFKPLTAQVHLLSENIELDLSKMTVETLEGKVKKGIYDGVLILSTDEDGLPIGLYKSNSLSEGSVSRVLQSALQNIKMDTAATQLSLTDAELANLNNPVVFEREALMEGAKSQEELSQARGIVYVLLFFIYFSVIMYANMIAMEVATEKSSRVMEILISSVSPVKQIVAKIIGIGLVGLTQQALLLLIAYVSITKNRKELVGGFFDAFGFGDVSISVIVYAIVFFLLGYFLYATLAALLGSLVSRIEDVQQNIMPMTFLVMIGFFIAMFGLGNPESPFITITSYIPFFTPMVMFLRAGMLNISVLEPILGIFILLVSITVLAVFGAKVYRGGVLMYGKSNSFKDIKKAIALTKK